MKTKSQHKRKVRTRSKIRVVSNLLRLSVYRSNAAIYAQIIDDSTGKTLVSASEKNLEKKEGTKSERAKLVGLSLAKLAQAKKITKVVFDRGSYAYHGRVMRLAEGAREGGLRF